MLFLRGRFPCSETSITLKRRFTLIPLLRKVCEKNKHKTRPLMPYTLTLRWHSLSLGNKYSPKNSPSDSLEVYLKWVFYCPAETFPLQRSAREQKPLQSWLWNKKKKLKGGFCLFIVVMKDDSVSLVELRDVVWPAAAAPALSDLCRPCLTSYRSHRIQKRKVSTATHQKKCNTVKYKCMLFRFWNIH